MFEKHKLEHAAKEQEAALARWGQHDQMLRGLLSLLEGGGGPGAGGPDQVPLVLKPKEHAVYLFTGGGLFEPHRGPGHYQGVSHGISIPIGSTGVRYRIGQSRGTFVQGSETQTKIDTGSIVVTTTRVVFLGNQRTVEWSFPKLVAIQHYSDRPWTAIQVSNRQKVAGVIYDAAHQESFRLRLEVALALYNNSTDELKSQVRTAIAANDAQKPAEILSAATATPAAPLEAGRSMAISASPPGVWAGADTSHREASTAAPTAAPNWYPDPAGRHEYRYWNGRSWTEAVSDRGVEGADAL